MPLNKNTKIWLNYVIGGTIALVLLWGIYLQVNNQLSKVSRDDILNTGPNIWLWVCIALMPVNILLEAKKWHLLANSAQPLKYRQALTSYLGGIAASMVTPNRVGEYPGRLLYLKRKNTLRLIGVSVLGILAQLLTMFLFGLAGLIYYNLTFDNPIGIVVLFLCLSMTIIIAIAYWKFEAWIPLIERVKWLRRFRVYNKLLKRFSTKEQLTIISISMIRYAIYTAQYLFLLYWMNINMPFAEGFMMSALFFWVIAVIPSISLVELTERGQVGLYLFQHYSDNAIGILVATVGIWCINLILPAVAGSILLFRMRFFR